MIAALTSLERFGWSAHFHTQLDTYEGPGSEVARVSIEHKGGFVVETAEGERKAEMSGPLRNQVRRKEHDRPAVGDWIVIDVRPEPQTALIHAVLPRRSRILRKAAGKVEGQVVAANVDTVLLTMALNSDFNLRRLERLLSIAWDSGATPVVVLTKSDLAEALDESIAAVKNIAIGAEVIAVSAVTGANMDAVVRLLVPQRTFALLGSSGVGKTTLINTWAGQELGKTGELRDDGKGRHTTTHRELMVLPSGAIVIDTPGMREVGLMAGEGGVDLAFADVVSFAGNCRFRDCLHQTEPGCGVRAALESGELSADRYDSYIKLGKEVAYVETTIDQRAKLRAKAEEKRIHVAYYKNPKRR